MIENSEKLLIIFIYFSYAYCYSFNTKEVLLISDNTIKDKYFSYSLLLQKGDTPMVIVGAPKDNHINNVHYGGQIYQCRIFENEPCRPLLNNKDPYTSNIPNGDFLGGALDGENHIDGAFVACSPRSSIAEMPSQDMNKIPFVFSPGSCIYRKEYSKTTDTPVNLNVSKIDNYYHRRVDIKTWKHYFDYGYALFGFDISFYDKDNVLFGAPGIKNENGATISFSLSLTRFDLAEKVVVTVLPERKAPAWLEEDSYFGYSVDTEILEQNSNDVWFVAGEPRANNLNGKVVIYRYDKHEKDSMKRRASFEGHEFGSYFGASVLAVDVTNDNIVDILIGSPMTAGKTFDEGSVCYHRGTTKTYLPCVELTGSSKIGSRFGTIMVPLGDFDLDGYKDVAISAPYENNGQGAVYIYRGSSEGLTNQYSQRLVSSAFTIGMNAKGFGLGISRGNDIDGNGHNDVAIGAYKTDQVFIVKSYGIIDYQVSLTLGMTSLHKNTTNFDLILCLNYTKRSKILTLPQVEFITKMNLDYRSLGEPNLDPILAILGKNCCKTYNIKIKPILKDVSPFVVEIKLDVKTKDIIGHGTKTLHREIPYALGCGSDNICTTGLTIASKLNRLTLILGQTKRLDLEILIKNDYEPAYQCELIVNVPVGIQFRNTKGCIEKHNNYTCSVTDKLDMNGSKKELLVFDVSFKELKIGDIEIKVNVTSMGTNKHGYKDKDVLKISVIEESSSYIIGKSVPETMELKRTKDVKDIEVIYEFSVGKTGPSPVNLYVDILLPVIEYNGENIFEVIGVKGTIDELQVTCRPTAQGDVNLDEILPRIDTEEVPPHRTIMVHCGNNKEACLQFACYGNHLNTTEQIAVFEVKLILKSSYLVPKFESELRNKNLIAYIPIAIQKKFSDSNNGVSVPMPFLIFVEDSTSIPLWAFLVAAMVSVLLLILMAIALYKCSFFDRTYKDKLERQLILDDDTANKKTWRKNATEQDVSCNEFRPTAPPDEDSDDDYANVGYLTCP